MPAFWYGLPRGYLRLELNPSAELFQMLADQILSLPEELRERADQVFRFYAGSLFLLNQQKVQGCAIGLHPDDNGGVLSSVITASTMSASGVDPKLVIATLVKSADETPDKQIQPLSLPCGTGFLFEEERSTTAPGKPSQGSEELLEGTVWQGTVAVPAAASSEIVVLQLVTSEIDYVDDYRDVLLGCAATVTFTDPSLVQTESSGGSPAAQVRSPFG